MLRGKSLVELTPGRQGSAYSESRVADLSAMPGCADCLSVCAAAGRPGLAVCTIAAGAKVRSDGTRGSRAYVYVYDVGRRKLSPLTSFTPQGFRSEGDASLYARLRSAVTGEGLPIFNWPAPASEGMAGAVVVEGGRRGPPKQRDVGDRGVLPPRVLTDFSAAPTFSPDGASLAVGTARRVALVQRTSRRVSYLRASGAYVYDLAFSPDGRRVAWAGDTSPPGPPDQEWAPDVNAVGVLTLKPQGSVVRRLSRVKGLPKRWTIASQSSSHMALSGDGETVFLLADAGGESGSEYSLGRADMRRGTCQAIADGVQDFALVGSPA